MKEVTKLVLHHDLEDLVKYQTSEVNYPRTKDSWVVHKEARKMV